MLTFPVLNIQLDAAAGTATNRTNQFPAIEKLPHGLSQFDAENQLVLYNPKFLEFYSLDDNSVVPGMNFEKLLLQIHDETLRDAFAEVAKSKLGFVETTRVQIPSNDSWISLSCEELDDKSYVVLHEDLGRITDDRQRIDKSSTEDSLTGLWNRETFCDRLDSRFDQLDENQELAILFIDLDHFKPVNDMLGHHIGDRLLQAAAQRIKQLTRGTDLVGRLGGDEFVICQIETPQPHGSRALAKRIVDALAKPFDIESHSLYIGASVGVALAPYDADTAEEMLKNADLALYKAKSDGRGNVRYYEPALSENANIRRDLETEMRLGIDAEQFVLNYQPVMDLASDRIVGLEALVRWEHPRLGRIPPDRFIPLAEETGLIIPLGEWVLRKACHDAASWNDSVRIAVNVSPVQLRNRNFALAVHSALEDANLSPHRLELEITETALMVETDLVIALLYQLRKIGVKIAMDDFGTGYSSINYLRKFPFDKIKIDRSFVSGNAAGDDSLALIKMIAALGFTLGVKTTAEGVETDLEKSTVRDAGCTEIQGYLLSKPLPSNEIAVLLHSFSSSMPGAN